jgi:hypothetical protein
MCFDGAVAHNKGSFGWAIATSTQILWESMGITTGWFANSFRSEGIGQLSLLIFLEAYIDYFQLHDLPGLNQETDSAQCLCIATDNKGLIERITSEIKTKIAFAGAALCADYDGVHETIEGRLPF